MIKWMDEVEFLVPPHRRNGVQNKRRLLLKHSSSPDQSRSVFSFRAPYSIPQYEERIYTIHDAPRAMLYLGDDDDVVSASVGVSD